MASTQPFTHSTTPILQAWLIKGLRLAHSKKPGDREKLHKLYEEACENEAQVCRITINEALKELRDTASELKERENPIPIHSSSSRIRPVQLIGDIQPGSISQTLPAGHSEPSIAVTSTTSTTPGRSNSRGKVAFFDMFGSATTTLSATNSQATTPSSTNIESVCMSSTASIQISAPGKTIPPSLTCSVGESPADPNGNSKSVSLDSIDPTCTVSIRSDIPPNTIIDLTCTEPTDSLSVLSAAASALDTKCTSTASLPVETIAVHNKSDDIPSTADPKILASLVADLACSVCGKLTTQPQMEPDGKTMNANILIECIQCGALYHQLCHQPPILSAKPVVQKEWRCGTCQGSAESTFGTSSKLTDPDADTVMQANVNQPEIKKTRQTGVELLRNVPSIGARKRKPGFVHPSLEIPRKLS